MAGFNIADLKISLTLDSSGVKKGLSSVEGDVRSSGGRMADTMSGIFQGVGQAIFGAIKDGVGAAISEIGKAVAASSNLNETINKTAVVFGGSAAAIVEWSRTSATSLGLSQQAALDAAGGFGALFVQLGNGQAVSADMSKRLIQLASDAASFYNLDPTVALEKIKSGLAGQSEPLRAINVFLTETAVAAKAVQLGLASSADAVSESAKVTARYNLILEQSTVSSGDFANTSKGLANAQRILSAEMADGASKLGDVFRPAVEAITNALVGVAPQMFGYGQNILDQLAAGLAAGIRAITPVITTIRQLFEYWFAPGSPPRVVPDIDKWGAAAMGQFLKGFSSVDMKAAFDTVGSAIETILRSSVNAGKSDQGGLVGAVFGTRAAIQSAVAEFSRAGSVSDATIAKIARSAGEGGQAIGDLTRAFFDVQKASTAATRAQDSLNRVTEQYDAILNPLRGKLDDVRAEQQKLANQQRLIAANNTLNNFESTASEKQAAALELQQISLEDQIATVEKQKAVKVDAAQADADAATKAQTAAKIQLDAAQATIDQQVKTNNLLGEQRQLEEQLASQREAAAKTAESEAKTAARAAKTAADAIQRDADANAAAQLRYNLQITDTPGKIALMEAELAKQTVGSTEYFNILTQLDGLHKQYNAELEKAAKAADKLGSAGGASIGQLGEAVTGLGAAISPGGKSLADSLTDLFAPIPAATQNVKALGDSISGLVVTIGTMLGIDFSTWLASNKAAVDTTGWDMYGVLVAANTASAAQDADTAAQAMQKSADATTLTLRTLQSDYKLIMDVVHGDWAQFWLDWAENSRLGQEASVTGNLTSLGQIYSDLGDWIGRTQQRWRDFWINVGLIIVQGGADAVTALGTFNAAVITQTTQWFLDLGKVWTDGAGGLVDFFVGSLTDRWHIVTDWLIDHGLSGISDLFPHSEPKDPRSPLRGLKQSGAALVDMFQSGMDAASFNINPLAASLLPAGATTTNSTANNMTFTINIGGGVNAAAAAAGAKDGVLQALRAAGVQ